MEGFDVGDEVFFGIGLGIARGSSPSRGCPFGSGRECEEGVPLDASISDVGGDEVALGSDVDLVSRLVVIGRLEDGFAGEYGVSAVGASLSFEFVGRTLLDLFIVHLSADGGPDSIGTHEEICLGGGSIGQIDRDAFALTMADIGFDGIPVLYEIGFEFGAFLEEYFLQVRSIDDAGVGQLIEIGTFLEGEFHEPIGGRPVVPEIIQRILRHAEGSIGTQSVLDAAGTRAGEGESVHDAIEQPFIDLLQHGQRVGRELDGSSKSCKGRRLFVDRHVKALVKHVQGRRETSHPSSRYRHL
mmetsp:Transcript_243/g.379  ORF Transcript_243/g.379 Transcript_243/m.379 type:complete len:299 (+) Transcript_243:800-1696(+)